MRFLLALPAITTANASTAPGQVNVSAQMVILWSVLLGVPALCAAITLFLPDQSKDDRGRVRLLALGPAIWSFLVLIYSLNTELALQEAGGHPFISEEHYSWISAFPYQIGYHLGADGISLPILLVTSMIFVAASLMTWKIHANVRRFVVALLVAQVGIFASLLALDIFDLLLALGLIIIPCWAMLRFSGNSEQGTSASNWMLGHLVGAWLAISISLLVLVQVAGQSSFDVVTVTAGFTSAVPTLSFWLAVAGFISLLGFFPLHSWVGHLQGENSSVIMVCGTAVPLVGGYGLIRICLDVLPVQTGTYIWLAWLAAVGSLVAAVAAMVEDDLRRRVSYLWVTNAGAFLLAIAAHSALALIGAVILLCANALGIALLSMLTALIFERTKTASLKKLGGLAHQMPRASGVWMFAVAVFAQVPFFAAFAGSFMVAAGSFYQMRAQTIFVFMAVAIAALSLILATVRIYFGEPKEVFARAKDLTITELSSAICLIATLVFFGLLHGRMVPVINNGVQAIIGRLTGAAG
jgi:NADH-quinone oxidoreductase subunit M